MASFIRCSSNILSLLFFFKDYDENVVRSKRRGELALLKFLLKWWKVKS
jgi:hypothetical protein